MTAAGVLTQSTALILTLTLVGVQAQIPFLGACPNPPIVQSFAASSYLGTWYEHKKYFVIFELFGKCVKATYTDQGSGTIGVQNDQVNMFTGKPSSITGSARPVDGSGAATLHVSFSGVPDSSPNTPNYNLVETDYTSYAVVWSCTSYAIFNKQTLWILTRQRIPNSNTVRQIEARLRGYGLNTDKLKETTQKPCSN